MTWVPTAGGYINASLPGELTRAQVDTVHSENCCMAVILSVPVAKSHQYQKGQAVFLVRATDQMGQEVWVVSSPEQAEDQIKADEEHAEARRKAAEEARQRAQAARGARIHAYDVVTTGEPDGRGS